MDLSRTARALRSLGADVLCLQELDRHFSDRSHWADQPAELGAALGLTAVFGAGVCRRPPTPGGPDREYGNAVLTALPVLGHQVIALPCPSGTEPRALLLARLDLGGGAVVTVGCLHLQHDSAAARAVQADAVRAQVAGIAPLVLAGDFNARDPAPELRALTATCTDSWEVAGREPDPDPGPGGAPGRSRASGRLRGPGHGFTHPARRPRHRLDRILLSPGVTAVAVRVLPTDSSDHRPVVADLMISPTGHPLPSDFPPTSK